MRRLARVSPIDALALVGLSMLALGVGVRLGWDVALALVGTLLLVLAVVTTIRSEEVPQ